jgi:hypothetical protein
VSDRLSPEAWPTVDEWPDRLFLYALDVLPTRRGQRPFTTQVADVVGDWLPVPPRRQSSRDRLMERARVVVKVFSEHPSLRDEAARGAILVNDTSSWGGKRRLTEWVSRALARVGHATP